MGSQRLACSWFERRQADLLEIVLALQDPRRLARRLHRRQQQGDQDANDRDHDQKLHQREADVKSPVMGGGR